MKAQTTGQWLSILRATALLLVVWPGILAARPPEPSVPAPAPQDANVLPLPGDTSQKPRTEAPAPQNPNDPTLLFRQAREAARAGRTMRALMLYTLVIESRSSLWPLARYNRGLLLEGEQKLTDAVLDYQVIVRDAPPHDAENTWLDAHTRLAVCLTKLQRFPEALKAFDAILALTDLDPDERLEALVGRGIAAETAGDDDAAELAYSDALHLLDQLQKDQPYDDRGLGAEASFRLGDVVSRRFATVALAFPQDLLKQRLEQKCQLLLNAQGRYLRSMRYGDHHTVAAAGLRIGNLYEALYDAIVKLDPPADMNAEEQEIYRDEVRKRVSVLVKKAILVYEKSLAVGRKTDAADGWVERLELALTRLKTVYSSESDPTPHVEGKRGLTSGAETVQ